MGYSKLMPLLSNEKGTASSLAVLAMVVLLSLGCLLIANAGLNVKLSSKSDDWNKRYYELDGKGEKFTAYVDAKLAAAQAKTNEYMEDEGYLSITHGELPMDIQSSFYEGYPLAGDKQLFLEEVMNKVYLFYANIEFEDFAEGSEFPEASVSLLKEGDEVMAIVCDLTLTNEEAPEHHLDISLEANYLNDFVYGRLNGERDAFRYRITKWTHWQNMPVEETAS